MPKKKTTPWKRPAPARSRHTQLSEPQKQEARTRARKAGRPYPNLVDNMTVAKEEGRKTPAPKRKQSTPRKAAPARRKASSPRAGRKAPRKTGGASRTRKAAPRKTKAPARKASGRRAKRAPTRDPRGGLTAAGRADFERRDGSRLRPGVRKPDAQLSREDMRRKGSWAVRFYGRAQLPPLQDAQGRPTRFALSAHAWGEPVPKTVAQAKRIAQKGRRLLERYRSGAD